MEENISQPQQLSMAEDRQSGRNRRSVPIWVPVVAGVAGLALGFGLGYLTGDASGHNRAANEQQLAAEQTAKDAYDKQLLRYNAAVGSLKNAGNSCTPKTEWGKATETLTVSDTQLSLRTTKGSLNEVLPCLEKTLGIPSAVQSQISMTNAYNGVQSAEFDDIKITWSYNGNSGLSFDATITVQKPTPLA